MFNIFLYNKTFIIYLYLFLNLLLHIFLLILKYILQKHQLESKIKNQSQITLLEDLISSQSLHNSNTLLNIPLKPSEEKYQNNDNNNEVYNF